MCRCDIATMGNGHRPRQTARVIRDSSTRWAKVDPALRARGHAGNRRLNKRWQTFTERGKNPLVANVAIARELAGWCWSLATSTSADNRLN